MSDQNTTARGAHRAPTEICPKCHQAFILGVTGTVEGCDNCTHTTRATNGYAIDEEEGDD